MAETANAAAGVIFQLSSLRAICTAVSGRSSFKMPVCTSTCAAFARRSGRFSSPPTDSTVPP